MSEVTTTLDVRELHHNAGLIAVLTIVGLPLSVAVLGLAGTAAFGFELPVALLFAAVILPTDPAAVLSLFEEFDVTERLAVTIEGEGLFNDDVAIISHAVQGLVMPTALELTGLAGDAGQN